MNIGATVVVRGRGIGTVAAIRDGMVLVDEADLKPGEESQFAVAVESVSETIRPIVERAEAERLIGVLGKPGARLPIADRAIAYRRAIRSGDLEAQAKLLASSYIGKAELPEHQYQERLENSVYKELGIVLGISRKQLRAKIRSANRGEAAPRSLALPDRSQELDIELPKLKGFKPIGAFAIDTRLAVGEARADVVMLVEHGVWLAYAKPAGDDFTQLVAVHRDSFDELATLAKQAKAIGRAGIDGAHIAIFDEAVLDDREIVDAMLQATFEIVEGRCAAVALGGDGAADVFSANKRYVRVNL
jgi:RNA polymerase-interacting CarD/CdnL/TRCF family regulator